VTRQVAAWLEDRKGP